MMALALGIGLLGFFALRRARRRCYAGGYEEYGWHGPWASHHDHVGDEDEQCSEPPPGWRRRRPYGRRGRRGWGGWAGPGGWRGSRAGRRRRWLLDAALERIDATPAQERAIVGELDNLQDRLRAVRGGLHEVRTDLAAAVRGSTLDDAALGAVLGRVDGATAEVRAAAIDALRNIHAVLDEKQRAELADMIDRQLRGTGGGGAGWWRTGPYR